MNYYLSMLNLYYKNENLKLLRLNKIKKLHFINCKNKNTAKIINSLFLNISGIQKINK